MAETDESYSGPEPSMDEAAVFDVVSDVYIPPSDIPAVTPVTPTRLTKTPTVTTRTVPGPGGPTVTRVYPTSTVVSGIPTSSIVDGIPTVSGITVEATTVSIDEYIPPMGNTKKILVVELDDGREIKTIPPDGGPKIVRVIGTPGAVFSLTMTDIDGCSILDSTLTDVSISNTGVYRLTVNYPTLSKSLNRFDLTITPGSNTMLHDDKITTRNLKLEGYDVLHPSISKYSIYQYPNPIATFTRSTDSTGSTNPKTLTLAGDNVTITGNPNGGPIGVITTEETWDNRLRRFNRKLTKRIGAKAVSWTATEGSGTTGIILYVSRQPKPSDFTSGTSYTKTTTTSVSGDKIKLNNTINLEAEMSVTGKTSYTKKVVDSIYPADQDPCDKYTDTFKLRDINKIFVGIRVSGDGIDADTVVTSIEGCGVVNTITIDSRQLVKDGTELTFSYIIDTIINSVDDINYITTDDDVIVGKDVTLTFDSSKMKTISTLRANGSGSNVITISGDVNINNFGIKDVTQTISVDDFITNTPNAYDQRVIIAKSTETAINMILHDKDLNARDKRATVVSGPSHGTVGSYVLATDSITYTPTTNYVGEDKFTFTMSDYQPDTDTIVSTSGEKTIYITVA